VIVVKCDICKEKFAKYEVFVEDSVGILVILSLCSTECEAKSPFRVISNPFYLDKTDD
jgi:hypothetical protein